ncbi:MAG: thioredoxin-disulfide reductase [Deltaproteobacteria bacterium]|nr:thioredoxin-disulfide reductase [Deltaproteobacteria bacterium]
MKTDLIILGGGPAGLTAGLYASRARIPTILLERSIPGGQMTATEWIENYPGITEPILGAELAQRMEEHARKFGLEIHQEDVARVSATDSGYRADTDSGKTYECRAMILATGASPVKLGIPGERELAGKGVSYCAVCDGPFFRDLEVAVVGGGDSAVEEAVYLARIAARVHVIHRRDELRAVKEIQEKAFAEPKITIHWSTVPISVNGERDVQSLTIRSVKDSSRQDLPVAGVFFYVGLTPSNQVFSDLAHMDGKGFVITDGQMACSRPGLFAAGDIRSKTLRQISTAVGEGAQAAYSAQQFLQGF